MNERLGYDAMMFCRGSGGRSDELYASRRTQRARGESDLSGGAKNEDFRKTYDAVARTNQRADLSRADRRSRSRIDRREQEGARRSDDQMRSRRADDSSSRENQVQVRENQTAAADENRTRSRLVNDNRSVDKMPSKVVQEKSCAVNEAKDTHADESKIDAVSTHDQGWQIIRQSLTVISEIFQLDLIGPVEDLDIKDVNDQVASQFAEILDMLKGIAGVLDKSAEEKVALPLQGMTIEPENAVELSKTVRLEAFRLEMAFSMIGVGEKVGSKLGAGDQGPGFMGIPVAQNPAQLQMPSYQLDQILDQLLNKSESTIESIVGKMKDLASGSDSRLTADFLQAVVVKPKETSQDHLKALDSPVLRAMLKLDGELQGSVFQADSGEEGDGGQGAGQKGAFGQNQSFLMQALQQMQQKPEANGLEVSVDASGAVGDKLSTQLHMMDSVNRSSVPSYRTIEQSVMQQVSERLGSAVRNGMHEVRIHLRPESLGEVELKIQMEGDVVTAKIRVESQQVRQIVEANLQALRDSLEEQNLHAGSFDVDVNQDSGEQTQTAFQAKTGSGGGGDVGASTSAGDASESNGNGVETGRRFGDNTIEYFA